MPQQNDMTQVLIERVGDGAPEDQSRAIAGVHESSQESSSALDVSSVAAMSSIVHSDAGQNESDVESEEFAKLRCSSVQTEVISARRRRNPSAGYPGLAFGSSLFSSGTIMKFRVISNELHNIQNVQLKRAEGEVAALQRRIQVLEKDLEKSEKSLKIATEELDIVCQEFDNKDDNRFDVILFDFE